MPVTGQNVAAAPDTRHCNTCLTTKPVADFYPTYKTQCRACLKAKAAPKRAEKLQYLRDWRAKNPDAFKHWREDNLESRANYWQRWYEENREHRAKTCAAYLKANRPRIYAIGAKRRAQKLRATPPWADLDAIRRIYEEAERLTRETGIEHEVDHYYPLQGKTVCGLHCEANLRAIPAVENRRKKNRVPDEAALAA